MRLVSVEQMIELEKQAVNRGLSYERMMENAGKGLADWVHRHYAIDGKNRVTGLVGSGNNGGDTLIALTQLSRLGWITRAYLVKEREPDEKILEDFFRSGGTVVYYQTDEHFSRLNDWLKDTDIILDGILGTGTRLPLRGEAWEILSFLQRNKPAGIIIAVDCPSGVDCDNGEAAEVCLYADQTICMAAVKQGLLKFPAFQYVGKLFTIDIGLPVDLPGWAEIQGEVINHEWVNTHLPKRPLDAHKGTFGSCLVIAGSLSYCGAVKLTCEGAYRVGAGLVQAGVIRSVYKAVAGQMPETIWLLLPEIDGFISRDAVLVVLKNLTRKSVMVLGPGLGDNENAGIFVRDFFEHATKNKSQAGQKYILPDLVIDADALRLLATISDWYKKIPAGSVLTPHPGEMAVLTRESIESIQSNRVAMAVHFAREWGHTVVLKGACTVVADPTGKFALVPVATPALATAGSGDVLAGMIGGLIAQGLHGYQAACVASWLHARAGKLAEERLGSDRYVLARDVLDSLKDALKKNTGL